MTHSFNDIHRRTAHLQARPRAVTPVDDEEETTRRVVRPTTTSEKETTTSASRVTKTTSTASSTTLKEPVKSSTTTSSTTSTTSSTPTSSTSSTRSLTSSSTSSLASSTSSSLSSSSSSEVSVPPTASLPSSTPAPSSTDAPAISGAAKTGTIIGGVGGGIIGFAVLICIVAFVIRRIRRSQLEKEEFNAAQFRRSAAIIVDDDKNPQPFDHSHRRPVQGRGGQGQGMYGSVYEQQPMSMYQDNRSMHSGHSGHGPVQVPYQDYPQHPHQHQHIPPPSPHLAAGYAHPQAYANPPQPFTRGGTPVQGPPAYEVEYTRVERASPAVSPNNTGAYAPGPPHGQSAFYHPYGGM